tara:strand:+ start:14340 stop:15068 length:729 start_codon:yes stop_codon:yes gene_type:complete
MYKKIRLGVNIDHVATIRNARGEDYPDPLKAALIAERSGADSVTIHLREDRRHIKDKDLKNIIKKLKIPINLEIAPTKEMLRIALKHKPKFVCIVPEKRVEITTEGGLNLSKKNTFLIKMINSFKKKNMRVSLFIEPNISDIFQSKMMGANCVELHTGKYCNLFNKGKNLKNEFKRVKKSADFGKNIGLEVHAGHGLNYKTAYHMSKIKSISELNVGHFIVSESIFFGLKNSIKKFIKIINR